MKVWPIFRPAFQNFEPKTKETKKNFLAPRACSKSHKKRGSPENGEEREGVNAEMILVVSGTAFHQQIFDSNLSLIWLSNSVGDKM